MTSIFTYANETLAENVTTTEAPEMKSLITIHDNEENNMIKLQNLSKISYYQSRRSTRPIASADVMHV